SPLVLTEAQARRLLTTVAVLLPGLVFLSGLVVVAIRRRAGGSLRRFLPLLLLVVIAAVLVRVVEGPRRLSGPESVRGPHVLRLRPGAVGGLEIEAGPRRLSAVRSGAGWVLARRPAAPTARAAAAP